LVMTTPVPTLSAVSVFEGNGSVLVKYELSGPIPQDDTFLVGIHGASRNGEVLRQFGVKFLNGESIAYFVFDHNASKQENFDYIQATEDAHQILTPYPAGPFAALGDDPKLRGYLNYAGADRQSDVEVQVFN
jgi:hypothetical protein